MLYVCKRCEYESIHIGHLKRHLSRIIECEDLKNCELSSAFLLKELDKDKTDYKHKCSFCDEQFQSTSGKYKHEAKCKLIQENIKLKNEIIKLKEENVKLKANEKEIEIKVLKELLHNQQPMASTSLINQPIQNNQVIQNQTIQNQTNETNIYNNITINAIGYENTDYITEEFSIKCIKNCLEGICDFIKELSFNKDHPENHNIRNIDDTCYEILSSYKISPSRYVQHDYKKVEAYKNHMAYTITKKVALSEQILNITESFFKDFIEKTDIKEKIGQKHILKFVEKVVLPLGWSMNLPEEDDIDIDFSDEFEEQQDIIYNMIIQSINKIGTHKKFIDL